MPPVPSGPFYIEKTQIWLGFHVRVRLRVSSERGLGSDGTPLIQKAAVECCFCMDESEEGKNIERGD